MEPQEKMVAEYIAKKNMTKQRDLTCKNGKFRLEIKDNDYEKLKFSHEVKNSGCANPRRNGSAFCQDCSDKHNSTSTEE